MNAAGVVLLFFGALNLWRPDCFSPEKWKAEHVFVLRCMGAVMIVLGTGFVILARTGA